MKWPMAALAPSNRDQSSCAPSRTGVTSTSSTPGLSGWLNSGCSDTPGAGGMSATASMSSSRSRSSVGIQLDDLDLRLEAVLVVDRACHPDRLMGRAEVHVAADLGRDVAAQAADAGDVVALGGLGQRPPDVALALPLGRHAAALHHHGRPRRGGARDGRAWRRCRRCRDRPPRSASAGYRRPWPAPARPRCRGSRRPPRPRARPMWRRSPSFRARTVRPRSRCCAGGHRCPDPCR